MSEDHKGFFVDLFVRASNNVAIDMYRKLGYDIYRTVNKYYSSSLDHSGEDAYGKFWTYTDMRKSLSRDPTKETSKPSGKRIEPDQLEWNWLFKYINNIEKMGACMGGQTRERQYVMDSPQKEQIFTPRLEPKELI